MLPDHRLLRHKAYKIKAWLFIVDMLHISSFGQEENCERAARRRHIKNTIPHGLRGLVNMAKEHAAHPVLASGSRALCTSSPFMTSMLASIQGESIGRTG